MNRILCFLFLMAGLACSKDEMSLGKGEYFIFGIYHGFCASECVTLYKLEDDKLYIDAMNRLDAENLAFSENPLPDSSYQKALQIWEQFPARLLTESDRIGMPDAHDQGGYFIRLNREGATRDWYIDTVLERLPQYLQVYITSLNEIKLP